MALIECVPNFSEGRDSATIAALIDSAGPYLLDHTSDADHNRTVLTLAGPPEPVAEAAFRAVQVAVQRIRLPEHQGVHPRIGAADVVPFVPLTGSTIEQCVDIATRAAERIWNELGVPVFLYEAAARDHSRRRLEVLRSPSFHGLPDFGFGRHPSAGAVIVGARPFLVAWNVNLDSTDLQAAREIARSIRASSGGFPCVKSLGLELRSRHQVQVSVNLTDFETTPLHVVFDRIREEAEKRGLRIAGSELIGLIPQRALELSRGHDLQWLQGDAIEDCTIERRVARQATG